MTWANVSPIEFVWDLFGTGVFCLIVYNLIDVITDKILVGNRNDATWQQAQSASDNLRNELCLLCAQISLMAVGVRASLLPERADTINSPWAIVSPLALIIVHLMIGIMSAGNRASRRESRKVFLEDKARARQFRRRKDDPPLNETERR